MSEDEELGRIGKWVGGSYDLAIELGPADDLRLDRAMSELWKAADLGPAVSLGGVRVMPGHVGVRMLNGAPWYSRVRLPRGHAIRCQVVLTRTANVEPGELVKPVEDSIGLCLPWSEVARADPRVARDPGDMFPDEWCDVVDSWFLTIASAVFQAVPFTYALSGFDAYGEDLAEATPCLSRLIPDDEGRLVHIPRSPH